MQRRSIVLVLVLAASGAVPCAALAKAPLGCEVENASTHEIYANSPGTLQEAVAGAAEGTTLKVRGTCQGDTTVNQNRLVITGVSSLAYGRATLDGANNQPQPGSVLSVGPGITLTLSGLTITGGDSSGDGGGVLNAGGALSIASSTVSGNSARNDGGGIYSETYGHLHLTNVRVTSNTAEHGGGIDNDGTFYAGAYAVLSNVSVTANTAEYGGGIYNDGSATITGSTITDNRAVHDGGGVGGGFGEAGWLELIGSTVAGNTAENGGGFYNTGGVGLAGTTVELNTASALGGGIDNHSVFTVSNSRVLLNRADGGPGSGGGVFSGYEPPWVRFEAFKSLLIANHPENCSPGAACGG